MGTQFHMRFLDSRRSRFSGFWIIIMLGMVGVHYLYVHEHECVRNDTD